jgi:hypothetical protein
MAGNRQAGSESDSEAKDITRPTSPFSAKPGTRRRALFVTLPCLVGAIGLTAGSRAITTGAALSLLLGLVAALGDLYLQKRRDDIYASAVREPSQGTERLRLLALYEAIRSRQLTSGDIVTLLQPSDPRYATGRGTSDDLNKV